jgi:hypothetical protein
MRRPASVHAVAGGQILVPVRAHRALREQATLLSSLWRGASAPRFRSGGSCLLGVRGSGTHMSEVLGRVAGGEERALRRVPRLCEVSKVQREAGLVSPTSAQCSCYISFNRVRTISWSATRSAPIQSCTCLTSSSSRYACRSLMKRSLRRPCKSEVSLPRAGPSSDP